MLSLYSSECKDGSEGRCSIEIPTNVTETKWTLTVENQLGKVELTDVADMTKRGTAAHRFVCFCVIKCLFAYLCLFLRVFCFSAHVCSR